jgi:hypothetical protein
MPGLAPGIQLFRKMDCRVEPGNDVDEKELHQ